MQNKVGDVVYEHYTPSQIGVVIKQYTDSFYCDVRWGTGKRKGKVEKCGPLPLFENLVLEHERKAKKHRDTLNRILAEQAKGLFP